jgi:plastocyanin
MHRTTVVIFAALSAGIVLLASCSSSSSTSSPAAGGSSSASSSGGGTITIGSDQANDHGTEDVTGMTSFELEADNDDGFYFKPTVITGSANQSLTLEIKNEGTAKHNFTIESLGVNVNIQPGQSQVVTVKFPGSGTVEFFCSFHRSLGMAGELQVG